MEGASAAGVKPVATIPQLAAYLVGGFWQYNNMIAHHWGTSTVTYNIDGLNVAEKFLAQSAFNAWHEVANLNFVQTSGSAQITFNHNGSMTAYETDSYTGSGILISATIDISADWITTDGGARDGKTGIDSYGYQTYIHEIGHALGLGHQGPYNGSASYSANATYANDTWQYSVMSYFSEQNYDGGSYRYVITPQMADIYAVQSIYGVASTRTGATVYGFNNTAGSIFNFSAYSPAPALTIYDSGGSDTLDCSGYSVAQTIDLHPGSFSSVGGLVHNIGIATNTTIECAIGGSGNDTLIANDAGDTLIGNAGNDTLLGGAAGDRFIGGAGTDTMTGGGGADIFAFSAGESSSISGSHDRITDFTIGSDKIDLTTFDAITSTSGVIDAFRFLATSVFDGLAASLNYVFDSVRSVTVLQGDTNGDSIADFAIDLTGNVALTSNDFTVGSLRPVVPLNLIGTAGNDTLSGDVLDDTLSGLGGNDTLIGNAGNDTLDGGAGADTMVGGTGNDTYVVDNAGDVVTEVMTAGFTAPSGWTVKGTADFNNDGQLDVLVTDGYWKNQVWLLNNGTVLSQTDVPGFSGEWRLQGIIDANGDGSKDLLLVYPGLQMTQYMSGLTALNYVYYSNTQSKAPDAILPLPPRNEGTDTVTASIDYVLPTGVENLTLANGAGALNGTGNALDNVIVGNEGNNILNGKAGVDTLTGGLGNDTFVFGESDSGATAGKRDAITDFTVGMDKIDLTGIDADTTVAGQDAFRFLGSAAFDGQAGALHTSYDAARNVTVLEGDTNGDRVADFGIDLIGNLTLGTGNLAAGSLQLPLALTGTSGADTLTGGKLDDTLSGLGGNDTLIGNAGNDTLDGGAGADTMVGGTGNDTYVVDNAGDVVTEVMTAGFTAPSGWTVKGTADFNNDGQLDVLVTDGYWKNQVWLLNNGTVLSQTDVPGFSGEWRLQGIIDANGDGSKDLLLVYPGLQMTQYMSGLTALNYVYYSNTQSKAPDAILPLPPRNEGTDTVTASIDYVLPTGVENLTLANGAGALNGTGNALDNVIVGNEGNNILNGKAGVDTLTGGLGNDTFVFGESDSGATAGKRDAITDFTVGMDKIDLTGIDADTTVAGQDAFRFLGSAAFDGQAGALHTSYDAARNVTVLEGDTNGDRVADFGIDLIGNLTLGTGNLAAGSLQLPLALTGTSGADTLTGGKLDDTLSGLGGNDTLIGNAGNDTLDGGAGADTMVGGTGNDTYVVDNAGDVVTEVMTAGFTAPSGWTVKGTADFNNDGQLDVLVTDGYWKNQVWLLNNGTVLSQTDVPGFSGEWRLQGIIDANGDGSKDLLLVYPGLQMTQYMSGLTALNYVYYSNTQSKAPDAILPLPPRNEGTDTVTASIDYVLPTGVENLTLANGAGALNGTGNALDNVIVGNEGNNILNGKAGVDTLTGGLGNDTFVFGESDSGATAGKRDAITDFTVGMDKIDLTGIDADTTVAGQDAFRFLGSAAFDGQAGALHTSYDAARNVTVLEGDTNGDRVADFGIDLIGNLTLGTGNLAAGSLQLPLALTGTSGADTLTGGKLDDTLSGLGGNDTLIGNAGNDTLDGGAGADTMVGGTGNDTYVVDNAGDVVTEVMTAGFTAPSGWTVKGTADFNNDGQLDVLVTDGYWKNQVWLLNNGTVLSQTDVPGFSGEWRLQGIIDANGDGSKDLLLVYPGLQMTQYMSGLTALNYVYYSNTQSKAPDAILPLPPRNEGTDTVTASIDYVLPTGVENLTLANGAGALNGTGNALDNVIVGNEGNNILNGKAGVDTLTGGLGNDTFVFGESDSGATAGKRDAITDFTVGMDKIDLTGIDADTTVAGQDAFRFLGSAAFDGQAGALHTSYDAARNVTVLEGDTNGDRVADFGIDLIGNLTLGTGNLAAGSLQLPLALTGTSGADTLTGGKLDDTLSGLGGNDTLIGNAGNDTLDGGAGADTMVGGTGNDTYVVDNAGDVVTEVMTAGFTAPSGWTVKGTADFNNDGQLDVLVTDGYWKNQVWLLNNGTVLSQTDVPGFSGEWRLQGIIDANGDGSKDLLLVYPGLQMTQYMSGLTALNYVYYSNTQSKAPDAILPLPPRNEGTDTVTASIDYVLPTGVENLTLANGAGALNGTGNALDNVIVGNEGNNILNGKAGVDTLTGGLGNDTFVFTAPTNGVDTITDWKSSSDADVLEISGAGFGGLVANSTVALVSGADAASAMGLAANSFFFDNAGADQGTLYWDATGGSGSDATAIVKLNGVSALLPSDFHIA